MRWSPLQVYIQSHNCICVDCVKVVCSFALLNRFPPIISSFVVHLVNIFAICAVSDAVRKLFSRLHGRLSDIEGLLTLILQWDM